MRREFQPLVPPAEKKPAICVAAAAVPSGDPLTPGAGLQVMRPRQG